MTRIRATCPVCGEVDLRPADVTLELVRDAFDNVAEGSVYRFDCPTCSGDIVKPADERIARLLASGGVAIVTEDPRPPHPEAPPSGPTFTLDDVITMHEVLATDDWFARLEASL